MAFIAWVREDSRARSISESIGGESRVFYDLRIHRRSLVVLRYLISAVRTVSYLVLRRPRAVIVQAPPVPAATIVWAWARLNRVPVVIDTHPASFGIEGVPVDRIMRPLLAWLARRAAGCIVTTPVLGSQISRWAVAPWWCTKRRCRGPRGCSPVVAPRSGNCCSCARSRRTSP
jgi:hypothetical protein